MTHETEEELVAVVEHADHLDAGPILP